MVYVRVINFNSVDYDLISDLGGVLNFEKIGIRDVFEF